MTRIAIHSIYDRRRASDQIALVPDGTVIEFKSEKRSLDQNAKMWACLAEISEQVDWYGEKLSSEDWKNVFTAALRQSRVVPGIDGISKVPLGLYTSNLSKLEFGDLLEIINAFAAERGIILQEKI